MSDSELLHPPLYARIMYFIQGFLLNLSRRKSCKRPRPWSKETAKMEPWGHQDDQIGAMYPYPGKVTLNRASESFQNNLTLVRLPLNVF